MNIFCCPNLDVSQASVLLNPTCDEEIEFGVPGRVPLASRVGYRSLRGEPIDHRRLLVADCRPPPPSRAGGQRRNHLQPSWAAFCCSRAVRRGLASTPRRDLSPRGPRMPDQRPSAETRGLTHEMYPEFRDVLTERAGSTEYDRESIPRFVVTFLTTYFTIGFCTPLNT